MAAPPRRDHRQGHSVSRNALTAIRRWQRDFFDHRLRSIESAAEKAQYIRMNPVRAGLVNRSAGLALSKVGTRRLAGPNSPPNGGIFGGIFGGPSRSALPNLPRP